MNMEHNRLEQNQPPDTVKAFAAALKEGDDAIVRAQADLRRMIAEDADSLAIRVMMLKAGLPAGLNIDAFLKADTVDTRLHCILQAINTGQN